MTQQKGNLPKANKLQKEFLSLSLDEQAGVTTFFNCHNAAHFVYDHLSEQAQNYVNYCIRLSQQADKIEKQNESAQDS